MIEVIIFDLDGLLIDSQHLQYKAVSQTFIEKGYSLTEKNWHRWVHENISFKEWVQLNNLPLEIENLRARKKEIYDELIKKELKLKPGANILINLLEGKYRLAAASSSRIESIELSINKFNLKSKFEHLISDGFLGKKKPNPEVFLHVAKIMEVKPDSCLVFEDSLAGLQAAKSAGMKCIVCPDRFIHLSRKLFANADKIVNTLDEVSLEMIKELEK